MSETRTFVGLTNEAAWFAAREYFRPINAFFQVFKRREPLVRAADHPREDANVEEAQAILRQLLIRRRHYERLMLTQCTVAAFASVLAAAISLLEVFSAHRVIGVVVVVVISLITLWMALRVVRNRETIVELKTVYRLMGSIDPETAQRVVKQVTWPEPARKRPRRRGREKHPH